MNNNSIIYDVIVVGAGPAGSTAAYYLSKNNKNLKILVVDRFCFPRDKACGGILNHHKDLEKIENYQNIESKLDRHQINTIQFYWNERKAFKKFSKPLFYHINRKEFDFLLLKEALNKTNVSFTNFNVEKIKKLKKYYILKNKNHSIKCKFIIGADGWCSKVSQYLGNKIRNDREYALCVEHVISCNKDNHTTHIFYFYKNEIGYAWLIPSNTGYYLGLGMVGNTNKSVNEYLDIFLKKCLSLKLIPKQHRILKTIGAPDPIKTSKIYASDTILLCGDALGTVKQATGEGIYYSMLSGKIAGETIGQGLDDISARYKRNIRLVIKSITNLKFMPPKPIILLVFKIISNFLTCSIIPKKLRLNIQSRFMKNFLEL